MIILIRYKIYDSLWFVFLLFLINVYRRNVLNCINAYLFFSNFSVESKIIIPIRTLIFEFDFEINNSLIRSWVWTLVPYIVAIYFMYLLIYTYLFTYIIKIKENWVMNLKETEWYIWKGLAGGIKREVT